MKRINNFIKSINKQTKIHCLLLIVVCLIQILIITRLQYVFGSNIDWMKQHITFPDYFRRLFYETGDLFPDFALHLGSGQNIFYFAYYGLLNPIILFSYLLPFMDMGIYIMISSILLVIVSVILLYYFLRKNNFNKNICFFASLLLLLSSSFLFHAHRHIMFVNYMPFLILALIGVYRYFEKKKSGLLIISIFLMILTSYYYSVSGLITICLYGLFYYLKENSSSGLKDLLKAAGCFLFRILLGILLSCILLLPVVYVILNGRNSTGINFDISYMIPNIEITYLCNNTYAVGLNSLLLISLIYSILYLKKEYKIISILLSIIISIPIINLLLNGGLYLNGKVFIPLLPIFLLLIATMIKDLDKHKIKFRWLVLVFGITCLILIENGLELRLFIVETIVTFLCLYLFYKKKKYIHLLPIILICFGISTANNVSDNLTTIGKYKLQQSYFSYDVVNYINQDTDSIYRYQDDLSGANGINFSYGKLDYRTTLYSSTSNINYWKSFYNTFNNNDIYRNHFMLAQTNNLFFQKFMGIRYLLTNKEAPTGYNKLKDYEYGSLYENENVYPIGFSSSNLLNYDEYNQLSYVEKLEAYQNNIIINSNSINPNLNKTINKINLKATVTKQTNLNIKKDNNHYKIVSKNNGQLLLELDKPITDKTLIVRFKMNYIPSCSEGDTYITINNIKNTLTCKEWKYYNNNETFDYVLSSNDNINELNIVFSKGEYDISDIEIYEVENSFFEQSNITPLKVDNNTNQSDNITGTIYQKEDGYFMFTIPYDEGFTVYVDDKQVEIEKVNDAFIGFPISKGEHNIKLEFEAPYFNLGKVISLITSITVIGLMIYEKKRSK